MSKQSWVVVVGIVAWVLIASYMARQVRYQMVIPEWLKSELEKRAELKKVSLAELIKDILKNHVEKEPLTPS